VELNTKVNTMIRFIDLVKARPKQHINYYAERLGRSSRTIRRYIDDASFAGVPIYLDKGMVGILENPTTETGLLNPTETFLLLLSLGALKDSTDDSNLYQRITDAVNRYANKFTFEEAMALSSRVKIYPNLCEEVSSDPKAIDSILKAIYANRTIEFEYQKLSGDRKEIRKVDPYYLFFKRTDWYLIGKCHKRNQLRIFRVGRMETVRQLLEEFILPADLSIDEYLADVWELEKGEEVKLELLFKPEVARIIMETKYHPLEKKEYLADGSIIYKVTCSGINETFRWILSFGLNVEVVKPISFRENLLAIGNYYINTYR